VYRPHTVARPAPPLDHSIQIVIPDGTGREQTEGRVVVGLILLDFPAIETKLLAQRELNDGNSALT
jgi:hypothetical protein